MLDYIKERHKSTRTIKFKTEFKTWLDRNIEQLESSSTQRPLNDIVAKYLYSRLLSLHPYTWRAIRYLNLWDCHANATLQEFGDSWLVAAPEDAKPFTRRFLELLAVAQA
jgi:hypothetical protein